MSGMLFAFASRVGGSTIARSIAGHTIGSVTAPLTRECFKKSVGPAATYSGKALFHGMSELSSNFIYNLSRNSTKDTTSNKDDKIKKSYTTTGAFAGSIAAPAARVAAACLLSGGTGMPAIAASIILPEVAGYLGYEAAAALADSETCGNIYAKTTGRLYGGYSQFVNDADYRNIDKINFNGQNVSDSEEDDEMVMISIKQPRLSIAAAKFVQ